jgi:hypothetical protein
VVELEKENDELREHIGRMELELSMLRTVVQRQSLEGSGGMGLASPAPSGGVNCDTCVVGKDCVCYATAVNEMEGQSVPFPVRQLKED